MDIGGSDLEYDQILDYSNSNFENFDKLTPYCSRKSNIFPNGNQFSSNFENLPSGRYRTIHAWLIFLPCCPFQREHFWNSSSAPYFVLPISVPDSNPLGSVTFGLPGSSLFSRILCKQIKIKSLTSVYLYFLPLVTNSSHLPLSGFLSVTWCFKTLFLLLIARRWAGSGSRKVKIWIRGSRYKYSGSGIILLTTAPCYRP